MLHGPLDCSNIASVGLYKLFTVVHLCKCFPMPFARVYIRTIVL